MTVFTVAFVLGIFWFLVSILGFMLMLLIALGLYMRGLIGIRAIVQRFELTIPKERASCLHLVNMVLFLIVMIAVTTSQIFMVHLYSGADEIVKDQNVEEYLKTSFIFELTFSFAFIVESVTCLIAGYLILKYSENVRSNFRKDPITGLEVPSLVFVFNQQ